MVQHLTANVAPEVQPNILTVQDDLEKLQKCSKTQKESDTARSMNSEKCFSECHDSDLFYFEAEIELNSLNKGDAGKDTRISTRDAHFIDGQQTPLASKQQENEQHTETAIVGTIPPVVQVVKHVEQKTHANDSRDNHVCDHPQKANSETPTLMPHGTQFCKSDVEAQLPFPPTAMVAQDLCKTDNFQPSQGMAENAMHAQPHSTSFDRDLQLDTTSIVYESKPATPRTNSTISPGSDCQEEEDNHTQQEDKEETRQELATTRAEDSMFLGFAPTVSLGALIGACLIILV